MSGGLRRTTMSVNIVSIVNSSGENLCMSVLSWWCEASCMTLPKDYESS